MSQRAAHAVMIATFLVPALGAWGVLFSFKMLLTVGVGLLAMRLQPAYDPDEATAADEGTAKAFASLVLPFNVFTVLEARWRAPESLDWGFAAFVALLAIGGGLAIRTWAVQTLGRFFTLHVQVTGDQPIIQDGPYRYVRHPAYTGALLFILGAPLLWHAWFALAAAAIAFGLWFRRRIEQEEAVLVEAKGEAYREYMRTTPALIPRVGTAP